MELTPRDVPTDAGPPSGRTGLVALVAVIVLAAASFVVYQGLSNATLYFRNVDEAVEQRDDLRDRRFRLQGEVVDGSVRQDAGMVVFAVSHGGVEAEVRHAGDPPELFQPGIPVVLEGHWEGEHFASDRMLVKHSSEYRGENPDRVGEYGS